MKEIALPISYANIFCLSDSITRSDFKWKCEGEE